MMRLSMMRLLVAGGGSRPYRRCPWAGSRGATGSEGSEHLQAEVGAGESEDKVHGGAGGSEKKGQGGAGAEKEGGDELSRDVAALRAEELALQSAPMKTFNDGTPRIYTAAKFDL